MVVWHLLYNQVVPVSRSCEWCWWLYYGCCVFISCEVIVTAPNCVVVTGIAFSILCN